MNTQILESEVEVAKRNLANANRGIGLSKSMAMTLLNKARERLSGRPPAEVFEAHFETTIQSIPCGIYVSYYSPEEVVRGPMSQRIDPPDPEEIEFVVLDGAGRRAEWLEVKITNSDVKRIEELIRRGAQ